jgi:type II secretory pathway component GspD/PulD (secretin)
VKNHQSIVVGGLMGLTASKTVHKVPFFGDLPYFGGLFRYTAITSKKTDLIIEVTPHILVDEYTYIGKSRDVLNTEKTFQDDLNTDRDQVEEEQK